MSTINVEMGTCRTTWGANPAFQTKGGVEVSYAPEYHEIVLDMYGKSPIDEILIGETMKAKVPIAETTYNNLKAVIPACTEVTDVNGKKKLTIGRYPGWRLSQVAQALTMHPLSYDDDMKEYDIVLHKAVPIGDIKFLYEFDKERVYEVTFVGLVDNDRNSGDFIATIGDPTIAADVTVPTVTSVIPLDKSSTAGINDPVIWTMSEGLNNDTVNSSTVNLYHDTDGAAVAGIISYNDATKQIKFAPKSSLTSGAKYVAVLTPGIKAKNGQPISGITVSTFTVA